MRETAGGGSYAEAIGLRAKAYARGANDYVVAKYDPVDGRSSTALTFSNRGSLENVNNKLNPEGPGEIRVANRSGNYPAVKAGGGGGQPNIVKPRRDRTAVTATPSS